MANELETQIQKALDPARMGWPPTMPIEVALQERSAKEICADYAIDAAGWEKIRNNPAFVKQVEQAVEDLKRDGMSFRLKARMQSEELLLTSWNLIHSHNDEVAPSVKADLIKSTWRVAGLDASKEAAGAHVGTALQININLGG